MRRAGERYTDWSFGELPELLELHGLGPRGDATLIGYPGLADREDSVELQVFDEPELAQREHRAGLRRLFALALREPLRFFERNLPDAQRLAMLYLPCGSGDDLRRELVAALLERACLGDPLPRNREAFEARVGHARRHPRRACGRSEEAGRRPWFPAGGGRRRAAGRGAAAQALRLGH
jgi:ATP-dependent helicase HrpA